MASVLESPAKKTGGAEASEAAFSPPTPPPPAQLCDDYRLVLVYVFDSAVILCTCETDPAFHETSLFKDHLPTIFGYQEPGFRHWIWSPFLIEPSGKGQSRKEKQPTGRCWIRDWQNLQDKHLESLIYLPFFSPVFLLGICHSVWGWVPTLGGRSWIQICPSPAVLTLHNLSKLSEATVNSWRRLPTPPWQGFWDI